MTPDLIPRAIAGRLGEALEESPVVLVAGPRQSGKSTLVKMLAQTRPATYYTLDDVNVLDAATADPQGFIMGMSGDVVIDEVQRVPELFRAIKLSADEDRRPGRFLLTGSANVTHMPRVSESLAGRMRVLTLWPLSQAEIDGTPGGFVDAAFAEEIPRWTQGATSRAELAQRVARGGFPESVLARSPQARESWANAYLQAIVERDVPDIANIADRLAMPRLLRMLAARAMTLLNLSEVSRATGIKRATLDRYVAILNVTYLVRLIPAWAGDLGRRLVKSPKPMLVDTGLLCQSIGIDDARLIAEPNLFGPILEDFVATELFKLLETSDVRADVLHFRTGEREVDIVLEDRRGRIVGIEVKASDSPGREDFRGLETMRDMLGERFHRGVLLHTGTAAVPTGDRLWSVPVDALWRAG